jgi:hypothetical protein
MKLTWKQFKERIEANGVTDEMTIRYIDTSAWEVDEINVSIYEKNEDHNGATSFAVF